MVNIEQANDLSLAVAAAFSPPAGGSGTIIRSDGPTSAKQSNLRNNF